MLIRGALVAVTVALAACASTTPHPVPGGPSVERDDFRFVAPTAWEVRESTEVSFGSSRRVLYLANQPLQQDCPTTGSVIICRSPLAAGMRPGGLLVIWTAQTCVADKCDLPDARLIAIGNRQGVLASLDTGCEAVGATEGSVYHVTVTPQRVDRLYVCSRNPSEATREAFLGFLDAIQWRVP